jgi:hypothetical protein
MSYNNVAMGAALGKGGVVAANDLLYFGIC